MMINSLRVFEKKIKVSLERKFVSFVLYRKVPPSVSFYSASISVVFFFLLLVAPFLYVACPCFFLFLLLSKEQRFS